MWALWKTRTSRCIHEAFVQRCLERDPGGLLRVSRGEKFVSLAYAPRVA